jgi:hypothetical protein
MTASRYSFDVETRHGSRWVINCIETQEQAARKRAATLFADPKCAGARIIRSWKRPDGVEVDSEIFCQTREVEADTTLRITRVESVAGICREPEDFYGYESRQAMSRIFRDYLAKTVLTPTEILHDVRHLKRLSQKDILLREAVDLVATLQTQAGDQDAKSRRTEIFTAIDAMMERARAIDPACLPKLDGPFGAVMGALGPGAGGGQRRTTMLAALSRDLAKLPSWIGKLELLCAMAEAETDAAALDLLDGVIADVLATDVIDDILGLQPNLGATTRGLFDLADGIVPAKTGAGEVTAVLCGLLAAGRLKASRRCVSERAHRALRSAHKLKPNDPEQEPAELRKLIARVVSPTGLHSGAETAHALTLRAARLMERGGRPGRRAAIRAVFLAMPDLASGVLYLTDAARSDLAGEHLADMEEVAGMVLQAKGFDDVCRRTLEPKQRMACATAAYHAIAASPFSPGMKGAIAGHIDTLLQQFVVSERIIEKLDVPDSHLRDRAWRLLRFCDSGLLPEGKALAKARARVLASLKQPDFPARFVAGITDPAAAQSALRDFFALLKRCGLNGQ